MCSSVSIINGVNATVSTPDGSGTKITYDTGKSVSIKVKPTFINGYYSTVGNEQTFNVNNTAQNNTFAGKFSNNKFFK